MCASCEVFLGHGSCSSFAASPLPSSFSPSSSSSWSPQACPGRGGRRRRTRTKTLPARAAASSHSSLSAACRERRALPRSFGRPGRLPLPFGRLSWLCLPLCCELAAAWNSFGSVHELYTFQDFYTDAQYGPDFGYYSTGKILHSDGPSDNGMREHNDSQAWFNSYTTLPMSLSPHFAQALCDRIVSMWEAMGRPSPFVAVEFGGGTGMLARDILRQARSVHPEFFESLSRYIIGERSNALRAAQQVTAKEFVELGKLRVISVDGRDASVLRPALQQVVGQGEPVRGVVLSNELLDEFDPARLRLVWEFGSQPTAEQCAECESYREAYVLHRVDRPALVEMLQHAQPEASASEIDMQVEEVEWEGQSAMCGLVTSPAALFAMEKVAQGLSDDERKKCLPNAICCLPFVLAIDHALQFFYKALDPEYLADEDRQESLVGAYRHFANRTVGTVPLTRNRYRQLRRLAGPRGGEVERALLTGSLALLPGRIHSQEVFLALTSTRCRELAGYFRRNAARFAAAAQVREGTSILFDGVLDPPRTTAHLKLVLRPGEASFVEATAKLVDDGFLVTMDYGADADALVWQALIRPHYQGIHIIDARAENYEECTAVSYLECPGLQDLTTSVDFTEVAVAGKELGGWEVRGYGPLFLLEVGFDATPATGRGDSGWQQTLGHLVERAGGLTTLHLQAWYRKPEGDPWASFKIIVQHRGDLGSQWTLGPTGSHWPLQAQPRLFRSPSPCWRRDITKPPMASLITIAAHSTLGAQAWELYRPENENEMEPPQCNEALVNQFRGLLHGGGETLVGLLDQQHEAQQQAFADLHLALLFVDYWLIIKEDEMAAYESEEYRWHNHWDSVRQFAISRQFHMLYGEETFNRVYAELTNHVLGNMTGWVHEMELPPHICIAGNILQPAHFQGRTIDER